MEDDELDVEDDELEGTSFEFDVDFVDAVVLTELEKPAAAAELAKALFIETITYPEKTTFRMVNY